MRTPPFNIFPPRIWHREANGKWASYPPTEADRERRAAYLARFTTPPLYKDEDHTDDSN